MADLPAKIGEDVRTPVKLVVAMLEQGIVGEETGRVLPIAEIDILRPGKLDPLDLTNAFHAVHVAGQRGKAGGIGCGSGALRQPSQRQTQHRRPQAAQQIWRRLPLHASHQIVHRLMSQSLRRGMAAPGRSWWDAAKLLSFVLAHFPSRRIFRPA